jgi:DNA primase large subunit
MIQKGKDEHHLLHKERLTLGIYLKSKNYDEEYILDIFRGLSDWDERITKYQLSRLGNYKCYGCDKMELEGLCKKENDTTGRCGRIKNPYNF